ncbi:MAG: DinB family protein [Candidatus Dojkabacteria bacterium]|nr:DinB family protein [Candidatus Dojkabacteria bacterium]
MLNIKDYSGKGYPHRSLLEVNADAHSQLHSVVESFSDENLSYKIDGYERSIGDVISHTLTTARYYFIGHLALGLSVDDYSEPKIASVKDALDLIQENLDEMSSLIEKLDAQDLASTIKTEWGQEMSKELAVWQGITQIMLHLGELCVMAGNGGFYKGTLG